MELDPGIEKIGIIRSGICVHVLEQGIPMDGGPDEL